MSESKFCKDCAHLLGNRSYAENWQNWKCGKTKELTGVNPVNGEPIIKAFFCTTVREIPVDCGPEGKWYEEYKKPTFLENSDLPIDPMQPGGRRRMKITENDLSNL